MFEDRLASTKTNTAQKGIDEIAAKNMSSKAKGEMMS